MNSYGMVIWLYKHLNNETIVDILMFSFFYVLFCFGFEVFHFIIIVKKDKNKVLEFEMMYFPYFEISSALF